MIRTIIQLANHSKVYLKGVLEDVLVQVNELIFTFDFYILDMRILDVSDKNTIILERSFSKNCSNKI